METLLSKLKPEIRERLEAEREFYPDVIDTLFDKLKSTNWYEDLRILEIKSLYLFSNTEYYPDSSIEVMHGTTLFNK
jgi:hypothetical protein